MKIHQAIREVLVKGGTISAPSIGLYKQTPKTLMFWLIGEEARDKKELKYMMKQYRKIITADDWSEDKK